MQIVGTHNMSQRYARVILLKPEQLGQFKKHNIFQLIFRIKSSSTSIFDPLFYLCTAMMILTNFHQLDAKCL